MTETVPAVGYRHALPITDPRALEDLEMPRPSPGPRDLIVDVRAVSVNPVDVKVRASNDPAGATKVLGYDASGVVLETGPDVTGFLPGDEVYYAGTITRSGTNAAVHAVDERIVARKPRSLSFAEAAALPLTGITAWEGLFDKLRITPESAGTLLMVGGPGGVGSMVIQLLRALAPNIRVLATASRPESAEWVTSLGAHEVIDHSTGLRDAVLKAAPDGVEHIFSAHTTGQLDDFIAVLKPFGQIVGIDDPTALDVASFKSKSLTWHWESMFTRSVHDTPDMQRQHDLLTRIADLVDTGALRTTATVTLHPIDATQLRHAHGLIETGRTIGKVVITNQLP